MNRGLGSLLINSLAKVGKEAAYTYAVQKGAQRPRGRRKRGGCTPCEAMKRADKVREKIRGGRDL